MQPGCKGETANGDMKKDKWRKKKNLVSRPRGQRMSHIRGFPNAHASLSSLGSCRMIRPVERSWKDTNTEISSGDFSLAALLLLGSFITTISSRSRLLVNQNV